MDLKFTELCKIVAEARGLRHDFWKQDPLYIRLSEALGPKTVKDTTPFEVAEPRDGVPSFNVDLDKAGEALGIEFF